MKILLVEKRLHQGNKMQHVLEAFGHHVDVSQNFDAAQLVLDAFHYDLVIADIPKYNQSSFDFIAYVKEQKKLPVIAMTTDNNFSAAFRILKFEPTDIIVTPEDEKNLVELQHTLSTSFYPFNLN